MAGSDRVGSVEGVYTLIQEGEDVNQRNEYGFTPLAVAAAAGDEALVALLLEKCADVALASSSLQLPLHHAAALGHRGVCQLLAPSARAAGVLDAANSAGWVALHLAAARGHEGVARTLVKGGAAVDARNEVQGGVAPSHVAAREGQVAALEALLESGGDANAADATGATPLHGAAARADDACVALLLRHRADASTRCGESGTTAQDLVPFRGGCGGRERVIRLLSAYARAEPDAPCERRRTDARFDLPQDPALITAALGVEAQLGRCAGPLVDAAFATDVEVLL